MSPPPVVFLTALRNEARVVGTFLEELHRVLGDAGLLPRCRLVIIDDASTDSTPEAVAAEASRRPGLVVEVLSLASNRGNQSAMAWGLRRLLPRLEGSTLVTFDADGEDDVNSFPELVRLIDEDPSRMVFVYRDGRKDGLLIRGFYLAYRVAYRLLTGQTLVPCNMMAIPSPMIAAVAGSPLLPLHFSYPPLRLGLPHRALPLARRPRYGGRSSQSLSQLIQHGLIGFTIFYEQLVARLMLLSAGLVAATALLAAALLALRVVAAARLPVGFTTAVFVSLIGFSYLSLVLLVVFCLACATFRLVAESRRDP